MDGLLIVLTLSLILRLKRSSVHKTPPDPSGIMLFAEKKKRLMTVSSGR